MDYDTADRIRDVIRLPFKTDDDGGILQIQKLWVTLETAQTIEEFLILFLILYSYCVCMWKQAPTFPRIQIRCSKKASLGQFHLLNTSGKDEHSDWAMAE